MDGLEQLVKPAGGRNPEETLHGLIAFVEDSVRTVHRHADEIARLRHNLLTVEKEIETPFEQVDELILCRMDMRRNECFGRKGRVPGKRTLAQRFRNISLAQNIPDNAFDAR